MDGLVRVGAGLAGSGAVDWRDQSVERADSSGQRGERRQFVLSDAVEHRLDRVGPLWRDPSGDLAGRYGAGGVGRLLGRQARVSRHVSC